VFGKMAGRQAAEFAGRETFLPLPKDPQAATEQRLTMLRQADGTERPADLRREMQETMFEHVGVFRTAEGMQLALTKLASCNSATGTSAGDTDRFNTDVLA
jgi:succinate dehydrogenase / fumarate reductase flavoprotein subunit